METNQNTLNIQVRRIEVDLAELFFNPREVDLRVGETLTLRERDSGRSVIVQVIAFRSATYPSLALDLMYSLVGPESLQSLLVEVIDGSSNPKVLPPSQEDPGKELVEHSGLNGNAEALGNIKIALAKIRKTVPASQLGNGPSRWEQWDGWIPGRDVEVFLTDDREVFNNATRNLGHPAVARRGW